MSEIESKALDTLRLLVNRLIAEIQAEEDKAPEEHEWEKKGLEELFFELNGLDVAEFKKDVIQDSLNKKIAKGKKQISSIDDLINQVASYDPEIAHLTTINEQESEQI